MPESPKGTAPTGLSADRQGIQVIARAAAIMRAVADDRQGLSLAELAARLELARSTVQRIVGALIEEGLLISAGPRAGVTLGPAVVRLADAAVVDTERTVRPVLQALSASLGETVDLSVLSGDFVIFVDQVVGMSRIVATSAIGAAFPAHCTANGKALLGRLSKRQVDALVSRLAASLGGEGGSDAGRIKAEIAEAAVTGLAWDIEEHAEGICAVGAAFADRLGRHFAVSVPVPAARFAAKRNELGAALRGAIRDIEHLVTIGQAR